MAGACALWPVGSVHVRSLHRRHSAALGGDRRGVGPVYRCMRPARVPESAAHNTLIVKKSAQRNRARIPLAFTDVTRRATLFNAAQNLENLARAHNLARAATRPMARFIDHAR